MSFSRWNALPVVPTLSTVLNPFHASAATIHCNFHLDWPHISAHVPGTINATTTAKCDMNMWSFSRVVTLTDLTTGHRNYYTAYFIIKVQFGSMLHYIAYIKDIIINRSLSGTPYTPSGYFPNWSDSKQTSPVRAIYC